MVQIESTKDFIYYNGINETVYYILVFEENVDDYSEGQIKHVAEEVVEEKEAENNDVKEDLEENINEAEVEDLKETDNNNEENAPQNCNKQKIFCMF